MIFSLNCIPLFDLFYYIPLKKKNNFVSIKEFNIIYIVGKFHQKASNMKRSLQL